jgi:hypothetical protein
VESWEGIGHWDGPRATEWKTRKNIVYEWLPAFEARTAPLRKHMRPHQAKLEDENGVGDRVAQQMGHDLTESLPTR